MKKILLGIFVVTFMVAGFSGQSWAMGKRHSSSSSSFSNFHHIGGNFNNPNSDNDNGGNPGNYNYSGPNGPSGNSTNDFPAATTVPEPATLALIGMGLAGGLLLKRKHA